MKKVLSIMLTMMSMVAFVGCSNQPFEAENTVTETNVIKESESTADNEEAEIVIGVSDDEFAQILNMANNSKFDLVIEDQFLEKDGYADGKINLKGSDAYCIEVKNNTGASIIGMDVYAVGLKDSSWSCMTTTSVDLFADTEILIYKSADFSLESGKVQTVGLRCSTLNFDKAVAFIASYTTADGTVHKNPEAQAWVDKIIESEKN